MPGSISTDGADVMLAGGTGQQAIAFFQQYGIETATGATGTIRHALEQYLAGTLQEAEPRRVSVEHTHEAIITEGEYEKDEAGRLREEVNMLDQQLSEVVEQIEKPTVD